MSSFERPHRLFLFEMTNGKKKLAYGADPADALEILRIRLTDEEMAQIRTERYVKIHQRDLMKHIGDLG